MIHRRTLSVRSIPACAGEPNRNDLIEKYAEVYPRVCGGTGPRQSTPAPVNGLSPRVRGNLSQSNRFDCRCGSIPACAGEPIRRLRLPCPPSVYPRVCGGTMIASRGSAAHSGLSPRVRGNRATFRPILQIVGSIPACAGEPIIVWSTAGVIGVYPRVCGGTLHAAPPDLRPRGLSPRVRGNPPHYLLSGPEWRSIPACAGEPNVMSEGVIEPSVYPRVCGGTCAEGNRHGRQGGLSPRVRGNPMLSRNVTLFSRSIPACAGEPQACHRGHIWYRVYPRVCGGTCQGVGRNAYGRGLSPRVRGNRHKRYGVPLDFRSIPACAGEPLGDWMK